MNQFNKEKNVRVFIVVIGMHRAKKIHLVKK